MPRRPMAVMLVFFFIAACNSALPATKVSAPTQSDLPTIALVMKTLSNPFFC